ncbi:Protein of unknown function [Pyronema omphalodes CBS 100304]|uniref:Uncharacterized protein n=1 Tax=Pyronema omphalodes (strain CBS 100304) TaxID=1076935 RepID=U4L7C8_PYROM|nr:Protein of unknown function [Pyronema omphalodes CBS 100304]
MIAMVTIKIDMKYWTKQSEISSNVLLTLSKLNKVEDNVAAIPRILEQTSQIPELPARVSEVLRRDMKRDKEEEREKKYRKKLKDTTALEELLR